MDIKYIALLADNVDDMLCILKQSAVEIVLQMDVDEFSEVEATMEKSTCLKRKKNCLKEPGMERS